MHSKHNYLLTLLWLFSLEVRVEKCNFCWLIRLNSVSAPSAMFVVPNPRADVLNHFCIMNSDIQKKEKNVQNTKPKIQLFS